MGGRVILKVRLMMGQAKEEKREELEEGKKRRTGGADEEEQGSRRSVWQGRGATQGEVQERGQGICPRT
jgi:hypothetical protein